jgi:hypothetical protein
MGIPNIQICLLTGRERSNWINPWLVEKLIQMTHDPRFTTNVGVVSDLHGYDAARNWSVDVARKANADWCIMIDNDVVPKISPLEMIAKAERDMWVLAMIYGVFVRDTLALAADISPTSRGEFQELQRVGAGCLAIYHRVWEKLSPPWFKWTTKPGDDLLMPEKGEDYYFADYCRENGIRIWGHKQAAMHLRTMDLTQMLCQQAAPVK